jgi:hypothetical protein
MPRYRVTGTFVFDLNSEVPYETVCEKTQAEIHAALSALGVMKLHSRVEKMRERVIATRLAVFNPADILDHVTKSEERRPYDVNGTIYNVRMNSHRYFIFRESLKCSGCGLEGTKMILELNPNHHNPHFNLYAEENGQLVLMTKDHVQPKAFGGEDRHSNYQTMCSICNNLKGAANLTLEAVRELRKLYNETKGMQKKKQRQMLEEARKRLEFDRPAGPRITPLTRRAYLAAMKSGMKRVLTTCDLNVWRSSEGMLVGRSVYEAVTGADQIACIKKGTLLEPVRNEAGRVIIRFAEDEEMAVYHGYLGYPDECGHEPDTNRT